ncbi:kinase-like domain-containing protein [Hyaloraphidium curvatum]|nr:kinase-like domain-containing protein [Hyaloraphidium curvatum]
MDDDSYHKNQRGGTPPFMAPELWSSDGPIGLPADVYTFAMTCWQVASDGDYPFTDLMLWELSSMEKFVGDGGRPDRPEDLRDDLRALMQRMWAQDPEDRPVMAEVVRELNRILRSWPETSY